MKRWVAINDRTWRSGWKNRHVSRWGTTQSAGMSSSEESWDRKGTWATPYSYGTFSCHLKLSSHIWSYMTVQEYRCIHPEINSYHIFCLVQPASSTTHLYSCSLFLCAGLNLSLHCEPLSSHLAVERCLVLGPKGLRWWNRLGCKKMKDRNPQKFPWLVREFRQNA